MPHKCTKCENIFKDGAAIILDGCPKCGGHKFLYVRGESGVPSTELKPETDTTSIPEAASKFIKEVDEIKGKKDSPKPEIRDSGAQEEVGDRVESVRILSQGSYELNLESLLERDEIIMALKEDGTYVIHLPSVFQKKKR